MALYNKCLWHHSREESSIYLTFDDGPTPGITPYALDVLKDYGVKATFFCLGKNLLTEQALVQRILAAGHRIGNHSMNHLNGWKTKNDIYLHDVNQCQQIIKSTGIPLNEKPLFRPPYGKITRSQYQLLTQQYEVVMWDVLSYDFNVSLSDKVVYNNVVNNVQNGSIIVMHDSVKASAHLKAMLAPAIEVLLKNGFTFKCL